MKKVIAVAVIMVAALAVAQQKTVSEVNRLKILTTYQKYVISSLAAQNSQQRAQEAGMEYQKAVSAAIDSEKLPKGTTFNVNVDTSEVTVNDPPKAPEKTPEKK